MPSNVDQGTYFGNLQYYKYYMLPTVQRLFGKSSKRPKNKHSEMVLNLLNLFALQGTRTTWQLAKVRLADDISALRTKEKEYRRLLVGRVDRGKHYRGLLELGLIVKDGFNLERAPANKYRLSLHGILYSIDVLDFDEIQIDKIAENYSTVLPKIFGKWKFLKKIEPKTYNKLKGLAKGLLLDNMPMSEDMENPINELMSYLQIKYHRKYENISEEDLAEQISYWFYTSLLISRPNKRKPISKLMKILEKDQELFLWYMIFYRETKLFYEQRLASILRFSV